MLTVCILVKLDICLACLALTRVKLRLSPPVVLYLHGIEEAAEMPGYFAQAEAFDVLKIILYCLFGDSFFFFS